MTDKPKNFSEACERIVAQLAAKDAEIARLQAELERARKVIEPFALPPGWHFIAYNATGSTACPFNSGEVDAARAFTEQSMEAGRG